MSIYFDNSATTKMDGEVSKVVTNFNEDFYANPSAMHHFGFLVEQDVKKATSDMAGIIGADASEIIWTSGGSESNNFAIKGYVDAYKRKGNHVITTVIEHDSVSRVFEKLENDGLDVTYLKVDSTGHIDLDELKSAIRKDTILVSIMYVNNIIGSVQDISSIGDIIKKINNDTAFHVDFVQGFGKYKINVKKSHIDLLSISSHKFYGPKGVGVLYKRKDLRLIPLILGGGQQDGLRSGTINAPGIIGTGLAADMAYKVIDKNVADLQSLRDYMIDSLMKLNEKYGIITINTQKSDTFSPHIVSVSFKGVRAEVMLHALEEKEIYVSAGSACSSHDKKTNATLTNIGLRNEIAESTIRISFGKYNTKDEVDTFIKILDELLPKLLIRR